MIADHSIPGATSRTFHIIVWLFVVAGVVSNVLVLIWRCTRKESRFQILSILIVSLAIADLAWCCHYLIQEIMMLKVLAGNGNETLIPFTIPDTQLCLISTFLSFASCNTVMTTAVGIALHAFFSLGGYRRKNFIVYVFLSISWISSLGLAASATVDMNHLSLNLRKTPLPRNLYSVITMFGCMQDETRKFYPVIVTSVNAASSVVCFVVYGCMLYRLRTSKLNFANTELKHLQIRLTVVVLVNVIVWWPPCITYWYSYVRGATVFNGKLNMDAIMSVMMLNVIVTAIDPLIYTMVSTSFTRVIRHTCIGMCCRCNITYRDDWQTLIEEESKNDESYCACFTRCQLVCRKYGGARWSESSTDKTGSSQLFPEVKVRPSSEMDESDSELE